MARGLAAPARAEISRFTSFLDDPTIEVTLPTKRSFTEVSIQEQPTTSTIRPVQRPRHGSRTAHVSAGSGARTALRTILALPPVSITAVSGCCAALPFPAAPGASQATKVEWSLELRLSRLEEPRLIKLASG